jgi:hypothetical protein
VPNEPPPTGEGTATIAFDPFSRWMLRMSTSCSPPGGCHGGSPSSGCLLPRPAASRAFSGRGIADLPGARRLV